MSTLSPSDSFHFGREAPVFDIVTTTACLHHDVTALSLAGTKKWWLRKMLERFTMAHLPLPIGEIKRTIEQLADAVMATHRLIPDNISDHPEFREVGKNMMGIWEEGVGACSFSGECP